MHGVSCYFANAWLVYGMIFLRVSPNSVSTKTAYNVIDDLSTRAQRQEVLQARGEAGAVPRPSALLLHLFNLFLLAPDSCKSSLVIFS